MSLELISQSIASRTTSLVLGTSILIRKSTPWTFSKLMRCARISNPTRCKLSRPRPTSSSQRRPFIERSSSMVSRQLHRNALQKTNVMAKPSMAPGVQFTIKHLESNWAMVRDLLATSGTILRTILVMILLVTVRVDSRESVPVTTSTLTPSAINQWLVSSSKSMVTVAWRIIMLSATMLSK